MKPAVRRWLARHARHLTITFVVLIAVLIALVAPLFLFGCAGPGHGSPSLPQATLVARTSFLDDALLVKITLDPVAGPGGAPGASGQPGSHGGHRPPPGGGGPGGPSGSRDGETGPALGAPTAATVRLHVAVTNQGADTLAFTITDVISELGNFVIRPERLSLAPHQTAEIDPLGAAYPATITELTVEVRLRHHGITESHTVRLAAAPALP